MLILSADDVRRALPMRAAIDSQRRAFQALSADQADVPLRARVHTPAQDAVTLVMPARVQSDLGAKIVSVFPRNSALYLPGIHGIVVLLDSETGVPVAVMDGTYLTALRTAAGSGAATEALARADARSLALLGSGTQARTHLLAMITARPIERATVYSPNSAHADAFVQHMQSQVNSALSVAASAEQAVRDADIVCLTTTSSSPVIDHGWMSDGAHLNAVGAHTPDAHEMDVATVRQAGRIFVESRRSALAEAGDVIVPIKAGALADENVVEIGAVLRGKSPGRTSNDQITIFKSVGNAAQDIAAAGDIVRRAREMGIGTDVKL